MRHNHSKLVSAISQNPNPSSHRSKSHPNITWFSNNADKIWTDAKCFKMSDDVISVSKAGDYLKYREYWWQVCSFPRHIHGRYCVSFGRRMFRRMFLLVKFSLRSLEIPLQFVYATSLDDSRGADVHQTVSPKFRECWTSWDKEDQYAMHCYIGSIYAVSGSHLRWNQSTGESNVGNQQSSANQAVLTKLFK